MAFKARAEGYCNTNLPQRRGVDVHRIQLGLRSKLRGAAAAPALSASVSRRLARARNSRQSAGCWLAGWWRCVRVRGCPLVSAGGGRSPRTAPRLIDPAPCRLERGGRPGSGLSLQDQSHRLRPDKWQGIGSDGRMGLLCVGLLCRYYVLRLYAVHVGPPVPFYI